MRKKLLITSAPRCGLKYITNILNIMGIDSRHNEWGRQAQATWKNLDVEECIVIHLLHNPFFAIPNIIKANLKLEEYEFRQQVILSEFGININQYNEIDNATLTFLLWNNMIEKKFPDALTLQVEKAHEKIRGILNNFNYLTSSIKFSPFDKTQPDQIEWSRLDSQVLRTIDSWCLKNKYPTITEQNKIYQAQFNKSSIQQKPNLYAPRRREVVAPHTSMTRPSKTANTDLADQVPIVPRVKHKVVISSGAADVSARDALKRGSFGIKQI